jgi:predicted DCC family thiol-disulfide oxidoreductase YuxK
MKRLHVLYDGKCDLCRRVRVWLDRQPAFVPLAFLPLQSSEVGRRFPGIEQFRPDEQLIVVSDTGDLWRGESAWITILWALREYREWAARLAHPTLRPFARQACALVSENRHRLSTWLRRASHRDLQDALAAQPDDSCECDDRSTGKIVCRRP